MLEYQGDAQAYVICSICFREGSQKSIWTLGTMHTAFCILRLDWVSDMSFVLRVRRNARFAIFGLAFLEHSEEHARCAVSSLAFLEHSEAHARLAVSSLAFWGVMELISPGPT